ncbi:aminotransferase class III-fold pyridoxal phosphate-dependent enzyme, partial [Hoeflea sp.]|uniref:aminotransferase class III-fold pyridoxal phosphate-dependent enzyme n=1 Tax=Hoeflea sp. TaxID=1940281 RepID=UPI0025C1B33B
MPETKPLIGGVPVDRIHTIRDRESAAFAQSRPKTRAALENGAAAFLDGVPMLWMLDWPQPFPMLVAEAAGARLTDIDGNKLDDFCLGDTGSMFGHSPPEVAEAIARQAARGLTYMLPTLDALAVGQLLQDKFGPFRWQIATTATDANRFAIRVARAVTGRPKVLFFAGCYHGAVDDAMGRNEGGRTVERPGLVGQVVDLDQTSVVVEFNDLPALEAALAKGNVAAVLAEPV